MYSYLYEYVRIDKDARRHDLPNKSGTEIILEFLPLSCSNFIMKWSWWEGIKYEKLFTILKDC